MTALQLRTTAAIAVWAALSAASALTLAAAEIAPHPATALSPTQLAIVINTESPLSGSIGNYYAQARRIPPATSSTSASPAARIP